MKILIILSLAVLGVSAIALLFLHIKSFKPLRSILIHAFLGLGCFLVINALSKFTGVRIPVNPYSVLSACVLGAPGVLGFLILDMMF